MVRGGGFANVSMLVGREAGRKKRTGVFIKHIDILHKETFAHIKCSETHLSGVFE